ncbi:MAG: family 2 glycosyl transferase [Flavobacteriaceae bacterium]|nr:family 2 glycosyl transferase [Flavobacteriaceae bacterium]
MNAIDISICIVSKDRKHELALTLTILKNCIDEAKHQVLVYLDGCTDGSEALVEEFPYVSWEVNDKAVGASPARNCLYSKARGEIIFGFDDDAHPLQMDFIQRTKQLFSQNPNIAVVAFEEIKGIYPNDKEAFSNHQPNVSYLANSFVGCGFAIKRDAYLLTNGFPLWMDIYGEEGAVSIQLIEKGYEILYTTAITVNHRVDRSMRKISGNNTFRFERQLCNSALYFIVFYPKLLVPKKLIKLLWHNWRRYALKDIYFFMAFWKGVINFFLKLPKALKSRNPVSKRTIRRVNNLPHPKYG